MMDNRKIIIVDGNRLDARTPVVRAESRGLMYGDGCFETFRSYCSRYLHLEKHLKRLQKAASFLELSYPSFLEEDSLREHLDELLAANDLQDEHSVLRVQLWREGERGYGRGENIDSHFSIIPSKIPSEQSTVRLSIVKTRRIPSESLPPAFKLTNNINYIQAKSEALRNGGDEALMLTTSSEVSETTIANIFWLTDGTIYTPSLECDILPGITREILINLCRDELEIDVETGAYAADRVQSAEIVFLCNSVREIMAVSQVDHTPFKISHPVFEELKKYYEDYRVNHLK